MRCALVAATLAAVATAASLGELTAHDAVSASLIEELDHELEKAAELVRGWEPVFRSRHLDESSYSYDYPTSAPTSEPSLAPSSEPSLAPSSEPSLPPTLAPSRVPTSPPTPVPTSFPTVDCGGNITFRVFFGPDSDERDALWAAANASLRIGSYDGLTIAGTIVDFSPSDTFYESVCVLANRCYMLDVAVSSSSSSSDAYARIASPGSSLTTYVDDGATDLQVFFCVAEDGTFDRAPSHAPTSIPTALPIPAPSATPTSEPTVSFVPTNVPSMIPTSMPTPVPTPEQADVDIDIVMDVGTSFETSDAAVTTFESICLDAGYEYALVNLTQTYYESFLGGLDDEDFEAMCDLGTENTTSTDVILVRVSCTVTSLRQILQTDANGDVTSAEASLNLASELQEESQGDNRESFIELVVDGIEEEGGNCSENLNSSLSRRRRRLQTNTILAALLNSTIQNITVDVETPGPSAAPSSCPTITPSFLPTLVPTDVPTFVPTLTLAPTGTPAPAGTECTSDDDCPYGQVCDFTQQDRRRKARALLFGYSTGTCVDA